MAAKDIDDNKQEERDSEDTSFDMSQAAVKRMIAEAKVAALQAAPPALLAGAPVTSVQWFAEANLLRLMVDGPDGVVRVHVSQGEQVPADHLLATVEPSAVEPTPDTEEAEGAGNA
mgnify:CR=1 FL=1